MSRPARRPDPMSCIEKTTPARAQLSLVFWNSPSTELGDEESWWVATTFLRLQATMGRLSLSICRFLGCCLPLQWWRRAPELRIIGNPFTGGVAHCRID